MPRRCSVVALVAVCVALPAGVASRAAVPGSAQTASAADGIYTEMQALRGASLYAEHCAGCHGVNLNGTDYGPGLSGTDLRSRWALRSLGELYSLMQSTMPLNSPGGLTAEQNADMLAYILKRAGFPAGTDELPARVAFLDTLGIEPNGTNGAR